MLPQPPPASQLWSVSLGPSTGALVHLPEALMHLIPAEPGSHTAPPSAALPSSTQLLLPAISLQEADS
ncbi:hypothetical protein P7K49_018460, partial [Saguinus oedipus]